MSGVPLQFNMGLEYPTASHTLRPPQGKTASSTRANIEVQGLHLWLSGIGRPTGNARTERVIGALKAEEIKLQDGTSDNIEARSCIGTSI